MERTPVHSRKVDISHQNDTLRVFVLHEAIESCENIAPFVQWPSVVACSWWIVEHSHNVGIAGGVNLAGSKVVRVVAELTEVESFASDILDT